MEEEKQEQEDDEEEEEEAEEIKTRATRRIFASQRASGGVGG